MTTTLSTFEMRAVMNKGKTSGYLYLAVVGALVATLCDANHVYTQTLSYPAPVYAGQAWWVTATSHDWPSWHYNRPRAVLVPARSPASADSPGGHDCAPSPDWWWRDSGSSAGRYVLDSARQIAGHVSGIVLLAWGACRSCAISICRSRGHILPHLTLLDF